MEIKDSDKPVTCLFCNQSEDNELLYGKFYRLDGDIITHYYCLLLSSNMEQNGGDSDGILGFLRADILKELKRGKRLTCSYCKSTGATLGCCMSKCKKVFHLPCGRKAGSLHQFFGQFKSFCASHRPVQKIDPAILAQLRISDIACPICYDTVDPTASKSTLWAPCCRVTALFHRDCVQKLAMSAGYFFRCPLCNNKPHFLSAMQDNGIYIPERDASWEMVPNAYQELLHRHHRCDAQRCQCPKGRNHELTGTRWELVLCKYCGSQGVHIGCGRLKWSNPDWECNDCKAMLQQSYERDEPENEGKEIQAFALVPDASEEEQSPSHPSSFRPIRRTGNNRRVGPRKPENIEKQPPAEEDSSSSHSTSTASHPVSPTLIVVSDDDEIIVIPDDDDDDEDDDDDDYNTSNRPQKKDPNVVLTGDGIAIPVVKVPNSEYEENFCIIGDLNVQVPKESEEIPSVVIQPHSSRSQDTNINLPVSQVSSTNNLRTKSNNMPIHRRLTSTARNNMRPQAPVSTDPTPAALVRYMPLTNSPSEGEQVPKRIRLSDPSPINYPENSSLGGNMLKTSFREPAMLSQTVNVNQSAMMMQQQQLAPAPQPTIMRGQSISRPAIMMMMPEQQQLGQHSMAIRAQSSNQSTMVVMQQQQPMQQQAEICVSSHPNSRWTLPQAQPPQYMVAMGSFIPQQVYQMPYMRPNYMPALQPAAQQQLIIQQPPQIQQGSLIDLTHPENIVKKPILEDIVTID